MNSRSQNILIIHYTDIAPQAHQRLCTLGYIKRFIKKPPGLYGRDNVELPNKEWETFTRWVENGGATGYWHKESQSIRVIHTCEQYVLVGTDQLIDDISTEINSKTVFDETLNTIWLQARHFVATELLTEWIKEQ